MGDGTNYCSVEVRRPNARKKVVDRYVTLSGDNRVANNGHRLALAITTLLIYRLKYSIPRTSHTGLFH